MSVVDSSAWLEYFGDGPNAVEFAAAVEDPDALVVPSLALFEVFSIATRGWFWEGRMTLISRMQRSKRMISTARSSFAGTKISTRRKHAQSQELAAVRLSA